MGFHRMVMLVGATAVLAGCASRSKSVAQSGTALPSQMTQPVVAARELPPPQADYDPADLAQQRREARPEPVVPRASSGGGFGGGSCH